MSLSQNLLQEDLTAGTALMVAVLAALETLKSELLGVEYESDLPENLPSHGLIVVREGEAVENGPLLGDVGPYFYQLNVEIELYVENKDPFQRTLRFDALKKAVGAALEADKTFGGRAEGIVYDPPQAIIEVEEGQPTLKTGLITATLDFQSATRI